MVTHYILSADNINNDGTVSTDFSHIVHQILLLSSMVNYMCKKEVLNPSMDIFVS